MNAYGLIIKGMISDLSEEDKARYEATLAKLKNAVDLESQADVIAATAFCFEIQAKLEG